MFNINKKIDRIKKCDKCKHLFFDEDLKKIETHRYKLICHPPIIETKYYCEKCKPECDYITELWNRKKYFKNNVEVKIKDK